MNNVAIIEVGPFPYYKHPVLQSISPNFGSKSGGTSINITGSNFDGVEHCNFVSEEKYISEKVRYNM